MTSRASKTLKFISIAFLSIWLLHLLSVHFHNTLLSEQKGYISSLLEVGAGVQIRYSSIDSTLQEQSIYIPEILTTSKTNTTVLKVRDN